MKIKSTVLVIGIYYLAVGMIAFALKHVYPPAFRATFKVEAMAVGAYGLRERLLMVLAVMVLHVFLAWMASQDQSPLLVHLAGASMVVVGMLLFASSLSLELHQVLRAQGEPAIFTFDPVGMTDALTVWSLQLINVLTLGSLEHIWLWKPFTSSPSSGILLYMVNCILAAVVAEFIFRAGRQMIADSLGI